MAIGKVRTRNAPPSVSRAFKHDDHPTNFYPPFQDRSPDDRRGKAWSSASKQQASCPPVAPEPLCRRIPRSPAQ